MTPSNPPQIFISYSHKDSIKVKKLYNDLKSRGHNLWIDYINLTPGAWKPQILRAIAQSKYFLLCLSNSVIQKTTDGHGFVDTEVQTAFQIALNQDERNFQIVSARLEDCPRGDNRISMNHQIDLFPDWDSGVDELSRLFV